MSFGVPQPIVPYDPFAAASGGSSAPLRVFDVVEYGATGNGATDDTAAIQAACAALQSNGGGRLHFPFGNYLIYGSGAPAALGTFIGLSGLSITSDGAKITFTNNPANSFSIFIIRTSSNIYVDPPSVVGPISGADIQSGTVKSAIYLRFEYGNSTIAIPKVKATGILTPIQFNNQNDSTGAFDTNARTKNVSIGVIEATNCWYGINAQYAPWNADIGTIKTDTVHRSVAAQGIRNVRMRVDSKNAYSSDVVITAGRAGGDVMDIDLEYKMDTDTTVSTDSAHRVLLNQSYSTVEASPGATFRNIAVKLNVKFAGDGTANTGASAVQFDKLISETGASDTTDRGHIIENLNISGVIENRPAFTGFYIIGTNLNAKWGAGDFWRNIRIHDLVLKNASATQGIRLGLNQLVDQIIFDNVNSTANIELVKDTYTGAPDNTLIPYNRFRLRGVACNNLTTIDRQLRSRAYRSTNFSCPNGAITAIPMNLNAFDVGGIHSVSVDTTRFTVPAGGTGVYVLSASVEFAASAAGTWRLAIWQKNGTNSIASSAGPLNATAATRINVSIIESASAGDFFEVFAYQDSGAALNVLGTAAPSQTWGSVVRIDAQ